MVNKIDDFVIEYNLPAKYRQDLLELYKNEFWTYDRVESDLDVILTKSSFVICIFDKSHDRLVAFTRGLTDYFKFAYIYDVIVHPEYRSIGLGKKLIDLALEHKDIKPIKNVELVCKKDIAPFYRKFGFSEDYGQSLIALRKQKID